MKLGKVILLLAALLCAAPEAQACFCDYAHQLLADDTMGVGKYIIVIHFPLPRLPMQRHGVMVLGPGLEWGVDDQVAPVPPHHEVTPILPPSPLKNFPIQ